MSANQSNSQGALPTAAESQLTAMLLEFLRNNPQAVNSLMAGLPEPAVVAPEAPTEVAQAAPMPQTPQGQALPAPIFASRYAGTPPGLLPQGQARPLWVDRAEPAGHAYHMSAARAPTAAAAPGGSIQRPPLTFQGVFDSAKISPGAKTKRIGSGAAKKIGPPGARVSLVLSDESSVTVRAASPPGSAVPPIVPPPKVPKGSFALGRNKQVSRHVPLTAVLFGLPNRRLNRFGQLYFVPTAWFLGTDGALTIANTIGLNAFHSWLEDTNRVLTVMFSPNMDAEAVTDTIRTRTQEFGTSNVPSGDFMCVPP